MKAHESGKEAASSLLPVQFFGKKASLVEVSSRPAARTRSACTPRTRAIHRGDEKPRRRSSTRR